MERTRDAYWLLWPSYYSLRFVFAIGYKFDSTTWRYRPSSKITSFVFLIIHIGIGLASVVIYYMAQASATKASTLIQIAYFAYTVLELVYILYSVIFLKYYNMRVISLANELTIMEQNLAKLHIDLSYNRLRRTITTCFVLLVTVGMGNFVLEALAIASSNNSLHFLIILSLFANMMYLVPHLITLNFYMIFYITKCMLETVNTRMKCVLGKFDLNKSYKSIPTSIFQLTKAHQDICEYMSKLNRCTSLLLLFSWARDFIMLLVGIFGMLMMTVHNSFTLEASVFLYMMLIVLVKNVCCIIVSNGCANQGKKMKKTIFLFATTVTDRKIRKQLNAQSLQLFHETSDISAGGWFDINSNLVFTMMSAIWLYTIMLLQFDSDLTMSETLLNYTLLMDYYD